MSNYVSLGLLFFVTECCLFKNAVPTDIFLKRSVKEHNKWNNNYNCSHRIYIK